MSIETIKSENCYASLKEKSSVVVDYCKKIIENKDLLWYSYFGFNINLVPRKIVLQEPVLAKINEKFAINRAAVVMMEPYQNYLWHSDLYRDACINMLLSCDHTSHCLFGIKKDEQSFYFHELKYAPSTFYIFNNKFQHSVINFEQKRYLFSIEFECCAKKGKAQNQTDKNLREQRHFDDNLHREMAFKAQNSEGLHFVPSYPHWRSSHEVLAR